MGDKVTHTRNTSPKLYARNSPLRYAATLTLVIVGGVLGSKLGVAVIGLGLPGKTEKTAEEISDSVPDGKVVYYEVDGNSWVKVSHLNKWYFAQEDPKGGSMKWYSKSGEKVPFAKFTLFGPDKLSGHLLRRYKRKHDHRNNERNKEAGIMAGIEASEK